MVASAMPPIDVVLRICLFPAAWLPGQRRLPVSMPRLAPMCKPRRIRRVAETSRLVPGTMLGAFMNSVADPVDSTRIAWWPRADAVRPIRRQLIKSLVSMTANQLRQGNVAHLVPGFLAFLRPHPGLSQSRRRGGERPLPPAIRAKFRAAVRGNSHESQRISLTRRAPQSLHRIVAIASRTRASSP